MTDRATILDKFGLPDRADYEIEPCRDYHGLWRIKFSHQGDPTQLISIGHAAKLAEVIRGTDPDFAERIDSCVDKARQYSSE